MVILHGEIKTPPFSHEARRWAGEEARKRITPEYDKQTGKLQLLKYDSNGNGVIDTWSYMDGYGDPPRTITIDVATEKQDIAAANEIFQTLLSPRGVHGIVVECDDCGESHFFGWELMRGNLRHLLDSGRPRVHEPAYDPDPDHYVTWEYARGYADGVHDTLTENGD